VLSIPEQYTTINIAANIFFLHGMYAPANNNIVPGGWSIGTEILFYAVFPILISTLFNKMRSSLLLTLLFPFVSFLAVALVEVVVIPKLGYEVGNNGFIYFSILNQFPVFSVGISAYFLLETHYLRIKMLPDLGAYFIFIAISFMSIYIGWVRPIENAFVFIPFMSAVSFFFLIYALKKNSSIIPFLVSEIGRRSYSMYLIHFVFAHQLSKVLNNYFLVESIGNYGALFVTLFITVSSSYLLAGITAKYIEGYFIKQGSVLIKNISNKSN
jgi:peptidoglycan/LPS O-acetylase OafA/YrhL